MFALLISQAVLSLQMAIANMVDKTLSTQLQGCYPLRSFSAAPLGHSTLIASNPIVNISAGKKKKGTRVGRRLKICLKSRIEFLGMIRLKKP